MHYSVERFAVVGPLDANNEDFQEVGAVLTHLLVTQTVASWMEEDTGLVAVFVH